MPRRGRYEKHAPIPDARYNNLVVTKFINKLMERGKKGRAEQIFYGTLDEMERRAKRPGIEVFEQYTETLSRYLTAQPAVGR